jgi:hypothetical protein
MVSSGLQSALYSFELLLAAGAAGRALFYYTSPYKDGCSSACAEKSDETYQK